MNNMPQKLKNKSFAFYKYFFSNFVKALLDKVA